MPSGEFYGDLKKEEEAVTVRTNWDSNRRHSSLGNVDLIGISGVGYLNSVSVILSLSIRDQCIECSVDLTEILSVELLTSETSVVEVPYQHK